MENILSLTNPHLIALIILAVIGALKWDPYPRKRQQDRGVGRRWPRLRLRG